MISNPKPMVTALVPSGNITPVSTSSPRRPRAEMASAAQPPIMTLINVAMMAKRSDVVIDASGLRPAIPPGRGVADVAGANTARHAAKE